jgi:hypothetical protein
MDGLLLESFEPFFIIFYAFDRFGIVVCDVYVLCMYDMYLGRTYVFVYEMCLIRFLFSVDQMSNSFGLLFSIVDERRKTDGWRFSCQERELGEKWVFKLF